MPLAGEILKASIVASTLGIGLRAAAADLDAFACAQRVVLRSLLTIILLVPLLSLVLADMLHLSATAQLGVALLVISPSALLVPQKAFVPGGRSELAFTLVTILALTATVSVPVWLGLITHLYVADASEALLPVTRLVSVLFLLPLVVGVLLGRGTRPIASELAAAVIVTGNWLLMTALLLLAPQLWHAVQALGIAVVVKLGLLSTCQLVLCDVAGRPREADRTTLAVLSATRHPAFALITAYSNFTDQSAFAVVLCWFVVSGAIAVPYAYWRKRHRTVVVVRVASSDDSAGVNVELAD